MKSINSYCKSNISTLKIENVHVFIKEKVIPELVKTIQNERNNISYSVEDLFAEYNLHKFSLSTTYKWMKHMGYNFVCRKKCYYVDSHESEENVKYRNSFIERYFDYELRCHRWYSIPATEKTKLVNNGELDATMGYHYKSQDGTEMVEFHVDDHVSFQNECNSLPFGGNLSVRMSPDKKKAMIFGQDECIFRQYVFTKGLWCCPDGTRQLTPKDEGQGVMLSSFCSRELGYGFEPSDEILNAVNNKRASQEYADKDAARTKFGTAKKQKLNASPFTRELEYGVNHDGYWRYEDMVLQMEDCRDILVHMFPDYDFIFLFDHSNGHDRLQPNGLSINRISIRFGGKQPVMRSSHITKDLLGPYHNDSFKLQPGMEQEMFFSSNDTGPCYMSDCQRNKHKFDINSGKLVEKNHTNSELVSKLKQHGIINPVGGRSKLVEQCLKLGISTKYSEEAISEGWSGKPKGSLQVLFERGWLNPDKIHMYTKNGKKDTDNLDGDATGCNFSIKALMKLQSDFMNEITLLQFYGKELGLIINRTPKCHPELAGEGIEYAWAIAKIFYRKSDISEKRTKDKFRSLVRKSTCPDTSLTPIAIHACSKKARTYMKLYKAIQSIVLTDDVSNEKHGIMEDIMKLYSRMKKRKKTHRNVADLNKKDVNGIREALMSMNGANVFINDAHRKTKIKKEVVSTLLKSMELM